MSDPATTSGQSPSFEEQLKALESIIERLENETPPLDEALESYEKGIKLAKDCMKRLEDAELRIQTLKLED